MQYSDYNMLFSSLASISYYVDLKYHPEYIMDL